MSQWKAIMAWETRGGLGDKCFLPFESLDKLQQFLTDQPALKAQSQARAPIQTKIDGNGEDSDEDSDEEMEPAPSSNSKGKLRASSSSPKPFVPQSSFVEQPSLERRKGQPLTLLFSNQRTGTKVYGGVLEFSAPSETVSLTPYLAKSLQLTPEDLVVVSLVTLPKGTFAKLQPLQPDYLEIPDFRAALESFMSRNFTTLTQGEVISLDHQGKAYDILVSELKPGPAVSITDTELEVDVIPLDALALSGQKGTQTLVLDGPSLLSQVKAEECDQFVFECEQTCNFRVFVKCLTGDADIFVSKTTPKPSMVDNSWFSVEKGDCEVQISHAFAASSSSSSFGFLPQNTYYIAVRGYEPETQYQISLTSIERKFGAIDGASATPSSSSSQPSPEHKQCSNCTQWILSRTYDMHTAFCLRNNSLCGICHRVVQKSQLAQHFHCPTCEQLLGPEEKEKHQKMKHDPFPCTCGVEFDLNMMQEHRRRYCPDRMINCKYCHDYVKAGSHSEKFGFDISQHEEYCGSRTIDCRTCKKPVSLKDLLVHEKHHEYEKQTKLVPFEVCHNQCCTNAADQSNVLGLCQRCFGPFWSSSHDPENKRLLQRLVARYFQQITEGCKSASCRNPHCLSNSRSEVHTTRLDPTGSAALALKLVQKSSLQAKKEKAVYFFCVDESISKRRLLATQLQNMGFQIEWCIKALAENKDDVMSAVNWLGLHAPSAKLT